VRSREDRPSVLREETIRRVAIGAINERRTTFRERLDSNVKTIDGDVESTARYYSGCSVRRATRTTSRARRRVPASPR